MQYQTENTVLLLPRLSALSADQIIDNSFNCADPIDAFKGLATSQAPPEVHYAEVGGSIACKVEDLIPLRDRILRIAEKYGYPHENDHGDKSENAKRKKVAFDKEVAEALTLDKILQTAEALRDDVWTGLCVSLLGDICYWRFGKRRQRFHGGIRNCFQRLAVRGQAFDQGHAHADRFELLTILSEDAMVGITERPSIASCNNVTLAIALNWKKTKEQFQIKSMESIMREAIVGIRIINEVRSLAILSDDNLSSVIYNEFLRASGSLPDDSECECTLAPSSSLPHGKHENLGKRRKNYSEEPLLRAPKATSLADWKNGLKKTG